MLLDLHRELSNYGMEISWSKTKCIKAAKGPDMALTVRDGAKEWYVPMKKELTTLGRMYCEGGGADKELDRRIGASWGAFWSV